jgi:hypothetical protein
MTEYLKRTTAASRRERRARVLAIGHAQDGVLARRQLYRLGVTRWEVEAELRAGRWTKAGKQTVRVRPPTTGKARFWRAVLEVGPTAVVDGVSALVAGGLKNIDDDVVHVAVPKSSTPRRCPGVRVHETRRYSAEDVIRDGLPRMKPATAAVHAALWARSNDQAALFVVAAVQQKLVEPADLALEVERVRRHARRALLRGVLSDVSTGVESMGEREFARLCAAHGLPEPTRQIVRYTPSGRRCLDSGWVNFDVSVEIDGAQHLDVVAAVPDALKQNAEALRGGIVLRIPVHALRTNPEPFFDQVKQALRLRGWRPPADHRTSG